MRYRQPSEQCKNLYRFIRLVLGNQISDREIARRWGIDEKNLRELKQGRRVVPKLSRLEDLAEVLEVHKYYVIEAASGIPAKHVYHLLTHPVLEDGLGVVEAALLGRQPNAPRPPRGHLQGLQAAAFTAYQTLEPDKIFPLVSQELKRHGFESHFFMLDQKEHCAFIRHSSFSPRLLKMAEKLTGLSISNFHFPIKRVPTFHHLLQFKHPVFMPDATVLLYQILGENHLRNFIQRIKEIFRILEVALTPIQIQGEVAGVFATGQNGRLNENCLNEVDFFSKQLSRSLENAFLFQKLKESQQKLQHLFENLPEGVFECDSQGRIQQINPAGAHILGFENPEVPIGKSIQEFQLLTPVEKTVRKHIKTPRKKTAVKNMVGLAARRDGSPFLTDITFRTQYGKKGDVERTEGIFRDISQTSH